MAKSRIRIGWILIPLILIGLALPKWWSSRSTGEDAGAPATSSEEPLAVRVEVLQPAVLTERLSTTGTVLANEWVELVAEVPGKVVEILFEEGAAVRQGDVLVRLDGAVARAELDRAKHRLELAVRREKRQQELLAQELISDDEYEAALAELNVLEAEVALREAQLEKTEIRAPFSGVIGLRAVSLGSYLTGQRRIANLQDVDPIKIEFSIPERYITRVNVGDTIGFQVKGRSERERAEVYAIEPSVDRETRSLTIRARTPNRDGHLVPGSFADVELAVREVPDALSVPSIAVVPELGGKKVYLAVDGVAQPRIVRTGIRTDERVEITDGLQAGDRVIVSAIQRLRTGLPVAAEAPAPADAESSP